MRILAYAMDYWSGGLIKAIFLEHEVIDHLSPFFVIISLVVSSLGLFQCCWLFEKIYHGCQW